MDNPVQLSEINFQPRSKSARMQAFLALHLSFYRFGGIVQPTREHTSYEQAQQDPPDLQNLMSSLFSGLSLQDYIVYARGEVDEGYVDSQISLRL